MKRALLISGLIATAVTAFSAAGITSGELDLPGLNQRIDNIDTRTTNNESDISKLQESTQLAPAVHVDVPVSAAPAPIAPVVQAAALAAPAPTPSPEPTCIPQPVISPAPGTSIAVIGHVCAPEAK